MTQEALHTPPAEVTQDRKAALRSRMDQLPTPAETAARLGGIAETAQDISETAKRIAAQRPPAKIGS